MCGFSCDVVGRDRLGKRVAGHRWSISLSRSDAMDVLGVLLGPFVGPVALRLWGPTAISKNCGPSSSVRYPTWSWEWR
jgi:hypothetical protein